VQPEVKAQMAILVAQAIQETLEQRVVKVIRGMTVPKAIQAKRVQAAEPQSLLSRPKHHQQNKFAS
jgi:phage tail sheath protein FI